MTGSGAEAHLAQAIARELMAPHVDVTGQTSLGQLAAVFQRCRLALGADSGPLHLAVAAGAPTVHLFGPIDPALFGPWGDPQRQVVGARPLFPDALQQSPVQPPGLQPAKSWRLMPACRRSPWMMLWRRQRGLRRETTVEPQINTDRHRCTTSWS